LPPGSRSSTGSSSSLMCVLSLLSMWLALTFHPQTELTLNIHITATSTYTVVSEVQLGVTNTHAVVSDIRRGVSNTEAMVSKILKSHQSVDDPHQSVSVARTSSAAEQILTLTQTPNRSAISTADRFSVLPSHPAHPVNPHLGHQKYLDAASRSNRLSVWPQTSLQSLSSAPGGLARRRLP